MSITRQHTLLMDTEYDLYACIIYNSNTFSAKMFLTKLKTIFEGLMYLHFILIDLVWFPFIQSSAGHSCCGWTRQWDSWSILQNRQQNWFNMSSCHKIHYKEFNQFNWNEIFAVTTARWCAANTATHTFPSNICIRCARKWSGYVWTCYASCCRQW